MIPPWRKMRAWVGAEELLARFSRPAPMGTPVSTLEALLATPEWEGSRVALESDGWVCLIHPSGARARVRKAPLLPVRCGRKSCVRGVGVARCAECKARVCRHASHIWIGKSRTETICTVCRAGREKGACHG